MSESDDRKNIVDRMLEYLVFRGWGDVCLVLFLGLAHGLAHGIKVFHSNQMVYFISGMRMYDPDFLAGDWFAAETYHYHVFFSYLLYLMQHVGSIELTTTVGYLVCNVVFVWGLYLLALLLCRHWRIALSAVAVWMGLSLSREMGLAQREIFTFNFEPAQVAGALLAAGVGLLAHRRVAGSAVLLGLGGMFHFGLLLAFGPAIAVFAFRVLSKQRLKKSLLWLAIVGFCWGTVFLIAWAALRSQPTVEPEFDPLRVMVEVRAPHHFYLSEWEAGQSLGWVWLTLAGTWAMLFSRRGQQRRELWWLYFPALAKVGGGGFLVWRGWLAFLTPFTLYRVAGLPFLMGLLVAFDYAWRLGSTAVRGQGRRLAAWVWMAFFAGGVAYWVLGYPTQADEFSFGLFLVMALPLAVFPLPDLARNWTSRYTARFLVVLLVGAFSLVALNVGLKSFALDFRLVPEDRGLVRIEQSGPSILLVCLVAALAVGAAARAFLTYDPWHKARLGNRIGWGLLCAVLLIKAGVGVQTQSVNGMTARLLETEEMLEWVRNNTDPKSVFVFFPQDYYWRMQMRRPVVVDYKSIPWLPNETAEWWRRYTDVFGLGIREYGRPDYPFFSYHMDTERAKMLRRKYGADYLVTFKNIHEGDVSGLEKVWENALHAIYRIPGPENVRR